MSRFGVFENRPIRNLSGIGRKSCLDNPDQGAAHNCSAFADCHNDHGLYYCLCWDGYVSPLGDGVKCENINECEEGAHGCPINSDCVDNDGSFVCKCQNGYSKFTDDGTNSRSFDK